MNTQPALSVFFFFIQPRTAANKTYLMMVSTFKMARPFLLLNLSGNVFPGVCVPGDSKACHFDNEDPQ